MGRYLVALLTLLALSGCVQVTQPPAAGLTDAARDEYAASAIDSYWGEPEMEALRPQNIEVTFVDRDNWGNVVVECMTAAGYSGYQSVGGGGISYSGQPAPDERYALLLCVSQWQIDPTQSGVLNDAELGYLYDFYRETTVPCMQLVGLTVREAPTKAEFIEQGGAWIPFADGQPLTSFEMGESPWYRSAPDLDLGALCPTWPAEWDLENRQG